MSPAGSEAQIVILGAGFAALAAARQLRRIRPRARIRLVAPSRKFVYRPSLIWIPVGLREPGEIEVPLSAFLARHAIDFTPALVTGIADGGRTVLTSRGNVRNDALVVATGTEFVHDLDGIEHTLPLCTGGAAAERIRARLESLGRGRIAIGAGANRAEPGATRCGPMLELAFGIDTMLRARGLRERFALTFFGTSPEPLKRFGTGAASRIDSELERRDIEVHAGSIVNAFSPEGVHSGEGLLRADLVVFTPGLTGPSWLDRSELPRSPGGFVLADETCAVANLERVFVAGDAGSFPGPSWSPKLAHMAQAQAGVVAANLHAVLDGQEPPMRLDHELACVIDTLDGGIAMFRNDAHAVATPRMAPMHWAKRAVERRFLASLAA